MPRPWFSKSGLSLCLSTMVCVTAHARAVDDHHLAAPVGRRVRTTAVLSPGSGGVMKRETYTLAVRRDRDVPRIRADAHAAHLREAGGVQLDELAGGAERDEGMGAARNERDAVRLGGARQADGAGHSERSMDRSR